MQETTIERLRVSMNAKKKGLQKLADTKKTEQLTKEDSRCQTWETNHLQILNFIHEYAKKFRTVPSISNISTETGLSRTTIYKHLSETNVKEYLGKEFIKYSLLMPNVLGTLYGICFDRFNENKDILKASKVQKR